MLFKKQGEQNEESAVFRIFGTTLGALILFFLEILQIVIVAAIIIVPIRLYVVKPFIVQGASMEPNLHDDEYLIIDEISYRLRDIDRGEIVVFEPPNNGTEFYIKRIIGLPGETVEIQDGIITVFTDDQPNGVQLEEEYISEYTHGQIRLTLGADEYFVLGDNRDASLDSRKFGAVHKDSIVGRAWLRGLPLNKLGILSIPDYSM